MNNKLLDQMQSSLDMIMSDVKGLYFLVSNNQRLESLSYASVPVDTDEYYKAYLIARDFGVYHLAVNTTIIDFYVFLPKLDMVLSPYGTFSSEGYLKNWFKNIDFIYNDWIDQFSFTSKVIYKASETETEWEAVKESISVIYPLTNIDNSGIPAGWLNVHLDKEHFVTNFKNASWTDESLLLIHHEESGIITSSAHEIPTSELQAKIEAEQENQAGEKVALKGREYLVQNRVSSVEPKIRYISLLPVDIYDDQFKDLTRFAIILFLGVFVLGSILIYRFAVARYQPVHDLLSMLKPNADGIVSLKSDEFGMIADSMQMTLKEDQRLRQDIKQSESILAQRFLKQLLLGEMHHNDSARERLSRFGIEFPKPYNSLILVDIELDEEADFEIRDELILNLRATWGWENTHTVGDVSGVVGFIVNHNSSDIEEIYDHVLDRKLKIELEMPAFLAIGISDVHSRDDGLAVLYTEATKALEFRLVKGRQLPIFFSDVQTSSGVYYYPIDVEIKLINSIKVGDIGPAADILEDVYDHNFSRTLPNLEIARCLMFDLISTMIKTLSSIPLIEKDPTFWPRIKPITRLMSCRSFEQLRVEMGEILERVCDFVTHGQPSRNEKLKAEIIEYIEANYRDKNLSPDILASHLNRNKAYLCRFFRECTATGISTYIKQHRIQKAKILMGDDTLSVHDLADMVGFSNSNAFIRAFKELEGITPGQYLSSIYV